MTYVGDRKRRAVTDGDAVESVDRMGGVEVTGVCRHVSGGAAVHVPVAAAGVAGWRRGGVKSRVPWCRRERLWRCHQGQQWQPAWLRLLAIRRRIGLRRGVERLVRWWPGAENTRGLLPLEHCVGFLLERKG